MIHYTHCPVCKSNTIQPAFSAKDHTVSGEEFQIWKCNHCTAMFTQDVPGQQEIGKYYESENYISHSDSRQGFVNQAYHAVRKRTLRTKINLIKKETGLSTGVILDIGCGTGAFLNTMQRAGWKITGLEPDAGARTTARTLYNIEPLLPEKIFELPSNKFNAITAWHVMEHVHQLHEYVAQLQKLLSEKGKIFIAVPNHTSRDAKTYQASWAAYDVPRHLYHFSPAGMKILMAQHGLRVTNMLPMWFDSFYVSLLSEQQQGSSSMFKAFFNGLVSNVQAIFNKSKCSSIIYVIERS